VYCLLVCMLETDGFAPSLICAGLIHANHGEKVVEYLSQELRSNSSEVRIMGVWQVT